MTVPDTRELAERVRRGLGAGDRLVPGTMSEEEHDAGVALAALVARVEEAESDATDFFVEVSLWRNRVEAAEARVEELTEALERSENDWTFLFNLADYSDLTPEVLRALAKVNLERARAVLVRESGGQP